MDVMMSRIMVLPILLVGLTVHEFAHAWSATLLGDQFPRRQGRVSLNPLRHLTLLGALAILLLPIGWGKPVMVNPYNFRHPRRDMLLVSLAGPAANLVLVLGCWAAMHLTAHCYALGPSREDLILNAHRLLRGVALLNVLLAVFNLLPIPPLDGHRIWSFFFPEMWRIVRPKMNLLLIVFVVLVCTNGLNGPLNATAGLVDRNLPVSDDVLFEHFREQQAYKVKDYAGMEERLNKALTPESGQPLLPLPAGPRSRTLGQLAGRTAGHEPCDRHCPDQP